MTPMLRLLGGHGFADYYSNLDYFDPKFDRDFRNKKDDDNVYYRGGRVYYRPYWFMCHAIKVLDKYSDNKWLGKGQKQEEWPVAYHGTKEENVIGIVRDGFRLDKGYRFNEGKGFYATPFPETALKFADEYNYNGMLYKLIIQTRVDPKRLQVVRKANDLWPKDEHWLLPDSDAIRPYAICVYELDEYQMFISIDDDEGYIFIDLKKRDTVAVLKEKIEEKMDIPPKQQRMMHNGELLEDSNILQHYNIEIPDSLTFYFAKLKLDDHSGIYIIDFMDDYQDPDF